MDIKPIRNEADYEAALNEVEQLWGAEPGTPDGDRFEVLFTLVESYEDQHYPILPPVSWLLDSSNRYFGIFDANFVRSRLCLLTGSTRNDTFNDNKLFIGGLYKIEIVFG
jgi:hypothetical protein